MKNVVMKMSKCCVAFMTKGHCEYVSIETSTRLSTNALGTRSDLKTSLRDLLLAQDDVFQI